MTPTLLRRAALVSLIALLLLAACGPQPRDNAALPNVTPTDGPSPTPPPTETPLGTEDPDVGLVFDVLTLTRTGGLDNTTHTVTVLSNSALLIDGALLGSVAPEVVLDLDDQLDRMGFFRLNTHYGPTEPRPDTYSYALRVERAGASVTVTTMDGFIPESMQPLFAQVLALEPSGPAPAATATPEGAA